MDSEYQLSLDDEFKMPDLYRSENQKKEQDGAKTMFVAALL